MTNLPQASRSSMVLTLDDWSPSFDRERSACRAAPPPGFHACEAVDRCWECAAKGAAERGQDDVDAWRRGGFVRCTLYVFDEPLCFDGRERVHDLWPEPAYRAKVTIWGADDSGMERYFAREEDARWFVCHLPVFVTRQWLRSVGFHAA